MAGTWSRGGWSVLPWTKTCLVNPLHAVLGTDPFTLPQPPSHPPKSFSWWLYGGGVLVDVGVKSSMTLRHGRVDGSPPYLMSIFKSV
ncbi:hypothetical protein FKM82_026935 [Ascaphus truei]